MRFKSNLTNSTFIIGIIIFFTIFIVSPLIAQTNIKTIGLYSWQDNPNLHQYWKSCGYNTLEFIDRGWFLRPDIHPKYYNKMKREIRSAQKAGFKVYVLLMTNLSQYKGPDENAGNLTKPFHPSDKIAMTERLNYLNKAITALKMADGFIFFAGDPGGVPKELGKSTVRDWIGMTQEVKKNVKEISPKADFLVNTWAITAWEGDHSAFTVEFWIKENQLTRIVVNDKNLLNQDCGIEFPAHNYYRSLALKTYSDNTLKPELYPDKNEIKNLINRDIKNIWAWPYFLVDEVDDGYLGWKWQTWGEAQAETRYIHKMINQMREIGMNGIIANYSDKGQPAEILNTYAFGQFCINPDLTPEQVIHEFAGLISTRKTQNLFSQILEYIENHSTWQDSLPPEYRMKNFDCPEITSADIALEKLSQVKPRKISIFPLPESSGKYLQRIRDRLENIKKAGNK